MKAYQLTPAGAPARLAMFRKMAAQSVHNANPHTRLHPSDWKGARHYTLASYPHAYCAGLNPGFNGEGRARVAVWYSHTGPNFREESDAGDTIRRATGYRARDYCGYYTDSDRYDTAIGIVARLPHGRFIAGYRWTATDERVYFPEVFTDESDAARMADEHARCFAESAREVSERFNAMQDAEIAISDAEKTLLDVWALRRMGRRDSDDVSEAIGALRNARETLADATRTYNRGF